MRTMKLFFGLFLVTLLLLSVNSQDDDDGDSSSTTEADPSGAAPPPDQVPAVNKTNGIMGTIEIYFWPFTSLLLQFINGFLIHVVKKQLPCTMSSITPFKYECTDLSPDQKAS
ncbi:uncharacterized protein LOC122849988 isoform X2 [Aphidius gifuensis]|uniref:uncharacterized protein LOC122849988 isoform X2 n=1 Tax=Aphidius gifuensis TaxID=684658 RepID=UPI001CDC69F0|nr:uncharacterized protein LOC122849988 isoform X2 [Aphidius gifuensis]